MFFCLLLHIKLELVKPGLHGFFTNAGINDLVIANRTVENAEILAKEHNGQAIDLSSVPLHLVNSDIVIASTASQLPILGKGSVESALKQRRHPPHPTRHQRAVLPRRDL